MMTAAVPASLRIIGWLLAAVSVGLVLFLLPTTVTGAVLVVALLALAALVSPWALFATLLVLAPLRTLIQTEAPIALPLDIGQILTALFAALWVALAILHRTRLWPGPVPSSLLPLLAFVAAGLLTWFYAISLTAAIVESIKWITIAAVAWLTFHMAGACRWRLLVEMLVIAAIANALVGIYIFFGGSGADHLIINNRFFRAFGTFGQPNPFAGFLGLALPLALWLLWDRLRLWWQTWRGELLVSAGLWAAGAVALLGAIIMSWSRGAWISVAASVVVMLAALPRRARTQVLLVVGSAGLAGMVWAFDLLPASISARLASSTAEFFAFEDMRGIDVTPENFAVVERLAHWQAALNMATDRPWGVGLGNYEMAYEQYRLLNWEVPLGHAHNFYLNVLAETGIIGAAAYGVFLLSVLYYTWKGRSHPSSGIRLLAVVLLGSWVYLIVHSLIDKLYVNNVFLHIGVLVGLTTWLYSQVSAGVIMEWHGKSEQR